MLVLCVALSPKVEDLNCYEALHVVAKPNILIAYIVEAPHILLIHPTTCSFDSPTGEILCLTYKEHP